MDQKCCYFPDIFGDFERFSKVSNWQRALAP